jgi:hypothetical protein
MTQRDIDATYKTIPVHPLTLSETTEDTDTPPEICAKDAVDAIIESVIYEVYLSREKPSLRVTHEVAVSRPIEANAARANPIPLPSYGKIATKAREIDHRLSDALRRGVGRGLGEHKPWRKSTATRPLESVDVGMGWLRVPIKDDGGKIVSPFVAVSAAICTTTSLVLGAHSSTTRKSDDMYLECTRKAITPKDYLTKWPDIKNSWPGHGIWENAIFDSVCIGAQAARHLLAEMGTQVHFDPRSCSAAQRFISAFSISRRNELKKPMTLQEFDHLLHRHVVDDWNVRPKLPRLQTPLDAWNSDIRKYPIREVA